MNKYRQNKIPVVEDKLFAGLKLGEIKTFVSDFFDKNLKNTKVKNTHKGVTVEVRKSGLRHLFHARNAGYVKFKAVIVLKEMIENAIYCNFNEPDVDDDLSVLGYMNFKCSVIVENKIQIFRIVVRITKDGKFYYDHSVKVRK
jgi:hypothetical protein